MEAYFNLESSEDVCVGLLGCNDNNFSFVLLLRLSEAEWWHKEQVTDLGFEVMRPETTLHSSDLCRST
jgi:hypothetical protein